MMPADQSPWQQYLIINCMPFSLYIPQQLQEEPVLPANAAYLRTEACTHTWGALAAVMAQLPLAQSQYYVVLDSSVRGPFVPPYAQHVSAGGGQCMGPCVRCCCPLLCLPCS